MTIQKDTILRRETQTENTVKKNGNEAKKLILEKSKKPFEKLSMDEFLQLPS